MRFIVRSRQMLMLASLLALIAFGSGARAEDQPAAKDEAAQPAPAKDPAMPGCPGPNGECCGACQDPAFKQQKGADAAGGGCPCQRARQMQQGS
jgi:hypothetical protein